jgi:acetyltransferase-like isoleucine patch superfamily enzyme
MKRKLERCQKLILQTDPFSLESMVRSVLIHYFYHVSDKQIVEVANDDPRGPKSVNLLSPTVFKGRGRIRLTASTILGVVQSPGAYACSYIEARTENSVIEIGEDTTINNRATIISEGAGIRIGRRCLIGPELMITDSNNHELEIGRRNLADQKPQQVVIGDDVFIGFRVTILKGCRVGNGCVIAAGCVVPPSFEAPPMSVIAGNPARIVATLVENMSNGFDFPPRL